MQRTWRGVRARRQGVASGRGVKPRREAGPSPSGHGGGAIGAEGRRVGRTELRVRLGAFDSRVRPAAVGRSARRGEHAHRLGASAAE